MAEEQGEPLEDDGEKLTFLAHLEELRARLIRCGVAVLAAFAVCYGFSHRLLDFFQKPVKDALKPLGGKLSVLHPMEAFMTNLKVAFVASVFLALPVLLYQTWKFVAPGLYAHEKRYVWPFVGAATFFFLMGATFAYTLVFPVAFKILFEYAGEGVLTIPNMESALDFPLKMLLAFGLVFELPVVVFFLAKMGLVTHKTLSRNRGYSLVIILIAAAVLTPTGDPFNQLLMAAPLYVLFEISIVVARVFGPKPEAEEGEAGEDVPGPA